MIYLIFNLKIQSIRIRTSQNLCFSKFSFRVPINNHKKLQSIENLPNDSPFFFYIRFQPLLQFIFDSKPLGRNLSFFKKVSDLKLETIWIPCWKNVNNRSPGKLLRLMNSFGAINVGYAINYALENVLLKQSSL